MAAAEPESFLTRIVQILRRLFSQALLTKDELYLMI